jgi:predicted DNA-binding protein (UPF0251 family)
MAPVFIEIAELEAFRLVDMEGLSQEAAGKKWAYQEAQIGGLYKMHEKKLQKRSVKAGPFILYLLHRLKHKK